MTRFRYIGDSAEVSVGIAGARFKKNVINEVPDERLAAELKNNPNFEEVTADMLPPVTPSILHAPTQGAAYSDPAMQDFATQRLRAARTDEPTGLGNISRDDQFTANVDALTAAVPESEVAAPAAKPAAKAKKPEV